MKILNSLLIDLVDKIERGIADLKTVNALPQLTNEVVLSRIEARLSNRLKMKWFDDQDSLPGDGNFSCMWQFLQRERKSALSFVRLRKEELEDKPDKPKKGRGAAHNVRSRADSSSSNQGTSARKMSESDRFFLHPDGNHLTRQCCRFLAMSVDERGKSLQENKACKFCLSAKAHSVTSWTPCPGESQWSPCQENNCGKNNSRLLHGCSVAGICNLTSIKPGATQPDSLLLYQEVLTPADSLRVLWDPAAAVTLITSEAARRLGLGGTQVTYDLTVVKGTTSTERTMSYHVVLVDRSGRHHVITAYEINRITEPFEPISVDKVVNKFRGLTRSDVACPDGDEEILVGMQFQHLHPVRMYSVNRLGLYSTAFGTGRVLGGTNPKLQLGRIGSRVTAAVAHHVSISNVRPVSCDQTVDFFTSEGFGINIKPKCNQCGECPDCAYLTQDISRVEFQELQMIKEKMVLNEKANCFQVPYPFKVDPLKLQNNFGQATSLLKRLERQLERDPEQAAAYCREMQKYIDRGVIVRIPPEELCEWKGPINNVSHHAVFKPDSASTPLRIVMNSSLTYKGMSLNSFLAKDQIS